MREYIIAFLKKATELAPPPEDKQYSITYVDIDENNITNSYLAVYLYVNETWGRVLLDDLDLRLSVHVLAKTSVAMLSKLTAAGAPASAPPALIEG